MRRSMSPICFGLLCVGCALQGDPQGQGGGNSDREKGGAAREPGKREVEGNPSDRSTEDPDRLRFRPNSAAFSPDGKRVAIGFSRAKGGRYQAPRLKIWDVARRKEVSYWRLPPPPAKGKPVIPFEREYRGVQFVSFVQGGRQILTVESDSTCRIWRADVGKLVREFSIPGGTFRVSLTADGKKLLTCASGGFALWDVETGKQLKQLEVSRNGARHFSVSPDGRRAFFLFHSSDEDATLMVYWDLENHRAILRSDRDLFQPILFSPDSQYLLARKGDAGDRKLVLCAAEDLAEVKVIAPDQAHPQITQADRAAFSWDGKKLLTIDGVLPIAVEHLKGVKHYMRVSLTDLSGNRELWALTNRRDLNCTSILAFSPSEDIALFVVDGGFGVHQLNGLQLLDTRNGNVIGALDDSVFGPR